MIDSCFWLVKSEPDVFSFDEMERVGITNWDGVRNYQARNNLKSMKIGDKCFFYHSNIGKEIVGVVEVCSEYVPDPSDETGKFGMVKMKFGYRFAKPVTLLQLKSYSELQNLQLLKQSRLSVSGVSKEEWNFISKLSTK